AYFRPMSQDIGFDRNEDHDPFFLSGPKRRIREARPGGGGQRVTKSGAGTVPAGSTRPVPPNPTVPRSFLPIPLLLLASLAWGQDDALAREWRQAMKWDSTGKHAQALRVYDRFVNEAPWAYRARMARSGL